MLRCISPFCSRPCCYREINDRYNKRNCDRTLHNAQLPNVITIRKIPYLINELQLISVVYLDATANTLKSESRARSWFLWKFRQEQFVSPCTAWLRRSCRCMLDVCVCLICLRVCSRTGKAKVWFPSNLMEIYINVINKCFRTTGKQRCLFMLFFWFLTSTEKKNNQPKRKLVYFAIKGNECLAAYIPLHSEFKLQMIKHTQESRCAQTSRAAQTRSVYWSAAGRAIIIISFEIEPLRVCSLRCNHSEWQFGVAFLRSTHTLHESRRERAHVQTLEPIDWAGRNSSGNARKIV